MNTKILITDFENYDEIYEEAYAIYNDRLNSGEYSDEYEYEDEAIIHDIIDEIYDEQIHEIFDAADLKYWWRENGWTLDRGYGGPNYKERLLESTNWDLIYEYIQNAFEVDDIFGAILLTPVKANDLVIFLEDDLYEEDDLDEGEY